MSEVDVANQALSLLGAKSITAFDDATNEATLVSLNYANVRDAVLEQAAWTFADASLVLENPVPGDWGAGEMLYTLPEGVIRIYRAYRRVSGPSPVPLEGWRREGDAIRVRYSGPVYATATMRIEDVDQWTAGFRQTTVARLAAELAMPITRSRSLHQSLWEQYHLKLRDAAASDAGQARSERTDSTELVRTRFADGLLP